MLGICSLILGLTVIGIVYNLKFPHLKDAHKLFRYLFYLPISLYCW
jgi:predicted membrane channel-forming protein YqfA (hemolysin III family)